MYFIFLNNEFNIYYYQFLCCILSYEQLLSFPESEHPTLQPVINIEVIIDSSIEISCC